MDYTKPFCIIERTKDNFTVYPTKFLYFKDENDKLSPLSEASGQVETLFARNEVGKIRPILRILIFGDDSETLQRSIQVGKRVKIRKNLSIADGPESNAAKKKRIAIAEKKNVNAKKKKINQATKDVSDREDGGFMNYVKPRSNANENVNKQVIDPMEDVDNSMENHHVDEHSNGSKDQDEAARILENVEFFAMQGRQDDQSNAGTSHQVDDNNFNDLGDYDMIFDDTVPVVDADLDSMRTSTPVNREIDPSVALNDERDEHLIDAGSNPTSNEPFDHFFSNLWPETNDSNVPPDHQTVNINMMQLKQCFKEFGGHLMENMLKIQKEKTSNGEEFEIPAVVNNKITIDGANLDATEVYKAKDVKTMRQCANHVFRAFWPLETRKKLVLSDRKGKPANSITIKQEEIEKIKKICKLLQKGRNFDKKDPDNCMENIRYWISDILRNDKRSPLTEDQKKIRNLKAKEWRDKQKLPPEERVDNGRRRKRQKKSLRNHQEE